MSEDQLSGEVTQVEEISSPANTENSVENQSAKTTPHQMDGATAILSGNEQELKQATDPIVRNTELSADDFGDIIDAFGPAELTLIVEGLADSKPGRDVFRKFQKVRRIFDNKLKEFNNSLKKISAEDPAYSEKCNTAAAADYRSKIAFAKLVKAREEFDLVDQKEKEENSAKKKKLLEKLREIVEEQNVIALEEVRNIQKEWKEIGQVKSEDMDAMYQQQKDLLDKFYDMRKKYVALIEIDRKVNYEKKLNLIKEVFSLIPEYNPELTPDSEESIAYLNAENIANISKNLPRNYWQDASEKMKSIHESWKATGAVSRDNSDKVWNDFRSATDIFFNAKRLFFGTLDAEREENEKVKRELLAKAEAYNNPSYATIDLWKENSESLIEIRTKWNETGAAPQSVNSQLNESFRTILDNFFDERKKYFDNLDSLKEDIVEKQKVLVELAEALKDSEDWKQTTDKLIELQKQWTEIGGDSFKESRALRKQFRKACDHFFRKKGNHVKTIQDAENKALEIKQECIRRIESAIAEVTATPVNSIEDSNLKSADLIALKENFNNAGRVPLKEKDKIQLQFNAVYANYVNLTVKDGGERKRLMSTRTNSGDFRGANQVSGDIDPRRDEKALQKKLKSIEEKIQLFKNNITFFASSKSNSALLKDIQAKIEAAHQDKAQTEKLIAQLKESRNKENKQKTEATTKTVSEEVTA